MSDQPLKIGEGGRYGDLAGRPLPAGLVVQFIPSLAAMLTRAEQLAGRPLTRDEVLKIRDISTVVVSESGPAKAVADGRGYSDLDPANPWPSWSRLRAYTAGDTLPG